MCLCGSFVEGDNEEAGKEKVVERRRDLRTTEVTAKVSTVNNISPSINNTSLTINY
jgi:hypothetical protein